MPTRSYTVPLAGFPGQLFEQYNLTSGSSPKVNGKLVLVANPHTFLHARVTSLQPLGPYCVAAANQSTVFPWQPSHYNECYAKWVGKLRAGGASMGVTLASWGQSSSMINSRLRRLHSFFSLVRSNLRRKPWLYSKKDLASDFLEGEFGFLPLAADIYKSVTTVCGNAIPPEYVHATCKHTHNVYTSEKYGGIDVVRRSESGTARITISAKAEISNPNLWLANRLGVINPATVAWDLVPWSFVVNYFVNVNQVLGALTDTVGLTITNGNVTRSSRILREEMNALGADVGPYKRGQSYSINVNTVSRVRTVGGIPMPSLSLRVPNVGFETAAIASALLVQRIKAF